MSDMASVVERLRGELEAAFRNRGDLYRLVYDELCRSVGPEKAEAILTRAIEERGREVARSAFARHRNGDARGIGEAFLAASPDGGRMYPTSVERTADSIAFKVKRCPLKDAWLEAGVDGPRLAILCRIAGAFDRGLFEETGVRFENKTWQPGDEPGCCWIRLTDKDASAPEVDDDHSAERHRRADHAE